LPATYVIANSQLGRTDAQGGLAVPARELKPVFIPKTALGW
jgi:hypothetical protein